MENKEPLIIHSLYHCWCRPGDVSDWEGSRHGTSYQMRKLAGCSCTENAGNVFPATDLKRKLLVSDPGMHQGTCVTHVPWSMSGSLTRGGGENVPGIPCACATRNVAPLIKAHGIVLVLPKYTGFNTSLVKVPWTFTECTVDKKCLCWPWTLSVMTSQEFYSDWTVFINIVKC